MADKQEFEHLIQHIGQAPPPVSWARRIRRFWDELFESRELRMVQTELFTSRLDKNRQIEALRRENDALKAKIEKLELAIWPLASRAGQAYAAAQAPAAVPVQLQPQATKWEQLVQQRLEENERLEHEESAKKEN